MYSNFCIWIAIAGEDILLFIPQINRIKDIDDSDKYMW